MHAPNNKADLETLKRGKPYIRSALAFILRLRFPTYTFEQCYSEADKFSKKLEEDVKYNQ